MPQSGRKGSQEPTKEELSRSNIKYELLQGPTDPSGEEPESEASEEPEQSEEEEESEEDMSKHFSLGEFSGGFQPRDPDNPNQVLAAERKKCNAFLEMHKGPVAMFAAAIWAEAETEDSPLYEQSRNFDALRKAFLAQWAAFDNHTKAEYELKRL
ncbi:hypothetical protein FRB99_006557 [Tulasnella sp. 403]|nr:hypothetical protein FRB99_006557 [Tulasnella sp. 403]